MPLRTPTLNADVTGATTITLDGQPVSLPVTVSIDADHTFELTATGPGGSVSRSLFVSGPALPPPPPGTLHYVRHYETNIQSDPRITCWFGKHVQGGAVGPCLYLQGGDGDWRFPEVSPPYAQNQSLNSVMRYDFSPAGGGVLTRPRGQFGDPADGTAPYYHDGCTWAYNSIDGKFYGIPGFQAQWGANQEVRMPYSERGIVHMFDVAAGRWEAGPSALPNVPAGNPGWVGEHWGGCFDRIRNRIWIQYGGGGEFGAVKWYDCVAKTFSTEHGLQKMPSAAYVPNIGYELIMHRWCQRHNPVTDELICYDGYRGYAIAIPLSGPKMFIPRIVANVPKIKAGLDGEPVETVEMGFCISIARQKAFLSTSNTYYINDPTGVYAIDLVSGAIEYASYPTEAGANCQYTACEYLDDPAVDALILWDMITDPTKTWGRRFLRYEF